MLAIVDALAGAAIGATENVTVQSDETVYVDLVAVSLAVLQKMG